MTSVPPPWEVATPGPCPLEAVREWYDWESGLTMHHESDGTTTLRSPRLDQAALH